MDGLAGGGHQRGCSLPNMGRAAFAKGLAQGKEGLAQALTRAPLGILGPEQACQGFPAVGVARFRGQIGQERPHLVRVKLGHRLPIDRHLQGTQQPDRQTRHGGSSPCTQ